MVDYKIIFLLLSWASVSSCGVLPQYDIYKVIPKGSSLDIDILKESRQIIPYESDLVLNLDISNEWNRFEPHLLFYDKELKLYAASYFPSLQVENLKDGIIKGVLHEQVESRKNKFISKLPSKYKTKFISRRVVGGRRFSDKIVEKIELNSNKRDVKMVVKVSNERYAGLQWNREIGTDENFTKNFTKSDSIELPLIQLNFEYDKGVVFTLSLGINNQLVRENILIIDPAILDDFYNELIKLYN